MEFEHSLPADLWAAIDDDDMTVENRSVIGDVDVSENIDELVDVKVANSVRQQIENMIPEKREYSLSQRIGNYIPERMVNFPCRNMGNFIPRNITNFIPTNMCHIQNGNLCHFPPAAVNTFRPPNYLNGAVNNLQGSIMGNFHPNNMNNFSGRYVRTFVSGNMMNNYISGNMNNFIVENNNSNNNNNNDNNLISENHLANLENYNPRNLRNDIMDNYGKCIMNNQEQNYYGNKMENYKYVKREYCDEEFRMDNFNTQIPQELDDVHTSLNCEEEESLSSINFDDLCVGMMMSVACRRNLIRKSNALRANVLSRDDHQLRIYLLDRYKYRTRLKEQEQLKYSSHPIRSCSLFQFINLSSDKWPRQRLWQGILRKSRPRRFPPKFSCKMFVGGLPHNCTEDDLYEFFSQFSSEVIIEEPLHTIESLTANESEISPPPPPSSSTTTATTTIISLPTRTTSSEITLINKDSFPGYTYVMLETHEDVSDMLSTCEMVRYPSFQSYHLQLTIPEKEIDKDIQIIPWRISDCLYYPLMEDKLNSEEQVLEVQQLAINPKLTVFVGSLHGTMTAYHLFQLMNDLYGSVIFVAIDMDRHRYPIGSARVVFSNFYNYFQAVQSEYIEMKTEQFQKKLQIDPYLEEHICSCCMNADGIYFCRDLYCFRYFCRACWLYLHDNDTLYAHRPIKRAPRRLENDEETENEAEERIHPPLPPEYAMPTFTADFICNIPPPATLPPPFLPGIGPGTLPISSKEKFHSFKPFRRSSKSTNFNEMKDDDYRNPYDTSSPGLELNVTIQHLESLHLKNEKRRQLLSSSFDMEDNSQIDQISYPSENHSARQSPSFSTNTHLSDTYLTDHRSCDVYPSEEYPAECFSPRDVPSECEISKNYPCALPPSSESYTIVPYPSETYSTELCPNGSYPSHMYLRERSSTNYPSNQMYPTRAYSAEYFPSENGTYHPSDTYTPQPYSLTTYPSEKYPTELCPARSYPIVTCPQQSVGEQIHQEQYPSGSFHQESYSTESFHHQSDCGGTFRNVSYPFTGQFAQESHSTESFHQESHSGGSFQQESYSAGSYVQDSCSKESYLQESCSQEQYVSESCAQESFSSYPSRYFPRNQFPLISYAAGTYPPESYQSCSYDNYVERNSGNVYEDYENRQ
ncbi:hypothetical protein SNEBB_002179 [Seison nebaliae]|nr:hypothetical protein SNEBB_002179 [Seison nebaliae]